MNHRLPIFCAALLWASVSSASPPTGFRCAAVPTASAIVLKWDPAPRTKDGVPAWHFRLWGNPAGVIAARLDGSRYVVQPSDFRGGRIPTDAVNVEFALQKVMPGGRESAAARVRVYVQQKRKKATYCKPPVDNR